MKLTHNGMLDTLGKALLIIAYSALFIRGVYLFSQNVAASNDLKGAIFVAAAGLPTLVFVGMFIVLTTIRLPPVKDSAGWSSRLVAIAGTFVTLFAIILPYQRPPILFYFAAVFFGSLGFGLAVYCLTWLGRSLSIDAQARRLVTGGPYSIIRHPLYVCECIGLASIPLGNPTFFAIALYVLFLGLQFWRAKNEERILASAFPEYAEYAATVPMLLPRFNRKS
jgi:protein-S-isoprenylcysteine O-methyltransferase Ste14